MTCLSLTPSLLTTTIAPSSTKLRAHRRSCSKISCSADDDKLGRRDVFLGLGGLYGASGLPAAMANPVQAPDLYKARERPTDIPPEVQTDCRAPASTPIDFRFPDVTTLRVRPAAHMAGPEYVEKYERALRLMKALPDDDPRSFCQQAKIHCAYCNGGYGQVGFPDLDLQVHNNWLFFPFHRWYLYFYERILGSLIGDPTFAIPFWNWDAPDGMTMPAMFTKTDSPLHDEFRNKLHLPPYVLDLAYDYVNPKNNVTRTDEEQKKSNLVTMYRQMVSGAKVRSAFFGTKFSAGSNPVCVKLAGTIENTPHTQIHILTGTQSPKKLSKGQFDQDYPQNGEDMGHFYSAGRDPIFYAHHGNVDRMWNLWKTLPLPGEKREDLNDPDFLNASFVFYDENKQLVKVKVRDCVNTQSLGYVYDDVPVHWIDSKPKARRPKSKLLGSPRLKYERALSEFPLMLSDSPVTVVVPRPKKGRSKAEKEKVEEILLVQGIDFDNNVAVRFDVFVNDEDGTSGPDNSEFAGSFGNVPHNHNEKISFQLGISDLLDDLGVDDDDQIVVTLIPRTGDPITVDGIKIELVS